MTIEEMCLWLEMHESPKYSPIIAALRAGQAMRDNPGSAKAMYEWDQATKETK